MFCDIIQDELLSKLHNSPYLSVIIDESTDISIHKKLIVFVKILNGPVAETHFLRNADVLDGTAQTITEKLREIFQNLNIPWSKVVCFSSDGASVMVGRLNGVATKLRELNPAMVCIHCAGHRLTLALARLLMELHILQDIKLM